MKTGCCERCQSYEVEQKVHMAEKDELHEYFYREHLRAQEEHRRLLSLLREVAWYNFELKCSTWRSPWPESWTDTSLTLCGACYQEINRRGRVRESGRFPVYYHGPLRDAPALPPEVVFREVQMAADLVEETRDRINDPYDWAPGGDKWEKLVRESSSAVLYEERRKSNRLGGHGGNGPECSDRLERPPEACAETTTKELLG